MSLFCCRDAKWTRILCQIGVYLHGVSDDLVTLSVFHADVRAEEVLLFFH